MAHPYPIAAPTEAYECSHPRLPFLLFPMAPSETWTYSRTSPRTKLSRSSETAPMVYLYSPISRRLRV
ncbi:hypothetical protein RSOLAG1IB_09526 [Rhizoctonia solani AG-1 IB]|uniref:Uncharacterized protein n=1 Tax=Thanatephorus cucumeris (strain AG1-IB / isolate 7/3/14) TaxID=1108050 RepID=A0A0B7FVU2_THACB|nr:hypothetical protein RSOLAG1IB_09526 [Rhizoctonia solani AG-1 IB]